MNAAIEILSELAARGVSIRADGDALKLKPAEALDAALIERVRERKPEILAALKNRPATCAASCYEIEPGRFIHHPWDSCSSIPPAPASLAVERICWHCSGSGRCKCIVCAEALPGGIEAECTVCKGSGKVMAWVH